VIIMNKLDYDFISCSKNNTCRGCIWPVSEPKALVYISHGMAEHIGRYQALVDFLNQNGFSVCGHDHLGHGKTAPDADHLGYIAKKDGWMLMVNDLVKGMKLIHSQYDGLPFFALGFSLGGFILRLALAQTDQKLSGAVIGGVGGKNNQETYAIMDNLKQMIAEHDEFYRSDLMRAYTRKIIRNDSESQKPAKKIKPGDPGYDPYYGFIPTLSAYIDVMQLSIHSNEAQVYQNIDHDLPLYLMSGEQDPLGDFGKLAPIIAQNYRQAGSKDVSISIYPGRGHEIFRLQKGEPKCDDVYTDLLDWLNAHLA
jgi:alpha-beta hydrolase superfamily lysophospholipase